MSLDKLQVRKVLKEIKENKAKLEKCKGPHNFFPADENRKWNGKYICAMCMGSISAINYIWYRRGLDHGRK